MLQVFFLCLVALGCNAHMGARGPNIRDLITQSNTRCASTPTTADELLKSFCKTLKDNDNNDDGFVDNTDIAWDVLTYNTDTDFCTLTQEEIVNHLTCRYGLTDAYAQFMFTQFDRNEDGVVVASDDFGTTGLNFTAADFIAFQYTRLQGYCGTATDPSDQQLCAVLETLDLNRVTPDNCRGSRPSGFFGGMFGGRGNRRPGMFGGRGYRRPWGMFGGRFGRRG